MKLVVAGSRSFHNQRFVWDHLDIIVRGENIVVDELINGGCSGVDELATMWGKGRQVPRITIFPALWNTHGRSAGPIRNKEMAEYGDMLVAFLGEGSIGTMDMLNKMKQAGKYSVIVPLPTVEETSLTGPSGAKR